jgi:hypothetical protein
MAEEGYGMGVTLPAFSHKRDSTPYSLKFYDTKSLEIFLELRGFALTIVIPKKLARAIYRDIVAHLLSSFPKTSWCNPINTILGD